MNVCPYCGATFLDGDMQFTMHTMRCEAHEKIQSNPFASQAEVAMQQAAYDAQLANYQSKISSLQNALAAKMSTQVSGATITQGLADMISNGVWDPEEKKEEKAKKKLASWAEEYFNGSQK